MRMEGQLGTLFAVFRMCLKSKYKLGTTDLLRSAIIFFYL